MIYMISEGDIGPVKLGWTADPITRRNELQVGNPRELRLLRVFKGERPEEIYLQQRFSDQRLRGDWFSLSKSMFGDVGLEEVFLEPEALPPPPQGDAFSPGAVLDGALLQSRLRQFRKSRGLTQQEVAFAVGASRSAIASIEAGHDLPGRDLLARLAAFFGVSFGTFEKAA